MLVSMCTVMALPAVAAATETLITNYFDFSTATNCVLNGSVGTAGGTSSNNYFFTSDYIAVTAGETVYFGPARVKQGYQFYAYDADKKITAANVGSSALTVASTLIGADTADNITDDVVIYQYTVPEGTAYLRVSTEAVFSRHFAVTRNEELTQTTLMKWLTANTTLTAADNLFDISAASQGRMSNASTTPASTSEYYSTDLIDLEANDVVYFGPVNLYQGYQAVFFAGTATTGTEVGLRTSYDYNNAAGNIKVVDTFGSGQAILAYRANQAGRLSVVLPIIYGDYYTVTKNKPFSAQAFYNYQDSQAGNNLYFRELDAKGALGTDGKYTNNHYTSHAIKVNEGDTIVFGPASEGQGYQLVTADINNANLKTVGKTGLTNLGTLSTFSTYTNNPYVLYSYTVPEGVSYVYTVNRPSVKEYFVTLKNSDVDTPAEYYSYMGMDSNNPATGKTALFVGDSISAGAGDMKILTSSTNSLDGFSNTNYNNLKLTGWAPRIAYLRQLSSYTNNSVGSSAISDARIDTAGTIAAQLEKSAGTAFDYVVIQGGINDADLNVAAGTVTDSYDPNTFDTSTFAGGLENTFYTAAKLYGQTAAIGYIFNYRLPEAKRPHANVNMEAYYSVVKAACEKWGIQYLDLFHNEQVAADLKIATAGAPELPDWLHVSAKGYEIITPYISSFIGTLTPYSSESNANAWAAMTAVLKLKAAEIDSRYFTADSMTAFKAAINAVTGTDSAAYEQLTAAGALLVQSETPLPFSLYYSNNYYYESLFETAGSFAVETAADFATMATLVNSGELNAGATVLQTADISLANHSGLTINTFAATYNGQNHTISNYSTTGTGNYVAMITYLSGTIKNLTVSEATVSGGWASAILVASTTGTTALLENVHIKNSSYTKTKANGGALLLAQPNSDNDSYTIRNCSVTNNKMTITVAASNMGFIASRGRTASCTIEGCTVSGNEVYCSTNLVCFGEIAGEFEAGTVKDCLVMGNTLYFGECDLGLFGRTKKGTIGVSNVRTDMATVSGGTSDTPAATINTSDLTVISAQAITENVYTASGVTLDAGDTLFFGPVKEGAAHLTFNGNEIPLSKLNTTGRFGSGQVIYAYTAAEAGTAAFTQVDYPDYFAATKNDQIMTVQTYYNYVDGLTGTNLFNYDLDYVQAFRNNSMVLSSNKAHSSTHMIKVTPGETISFGPAIPTQGYQGVTFTADGLPVTTVTAGNYPDNLTTVTLPSGLVIYNLVIPEGVGYLELVNSTTMNTLYYAKRGAMTEADLNAHMGLDSATNPLYGKSALFVGDSITHATQDASGSGFNTTGKTGWAIRIAAANGMAYMNGGVSGASLSTARGDNRILNQLETYKNNEYDYVVIHGGVNDAWDNARVGAVSSSFDPATFDTSTYAGGLEEAIYTALRYYGDKATVFYLINFESPMHAKSCDSGMYFEVGKEVCEKWGIPYFDMAGNQEISNALDIYTSGGAYVTDNIHPQPIGYDVLYPYIANFMKTLTPNTTGVNPAVTALQSQAAAVDSKYFTESSYAQFTAAITAAGNDYDALVAAATLPVSNGTEIPLGLGENNTYYFRALTQQKTFTVTTGADFAVLASISKAVQLTADVQVTQTADIDLADYLNCRVGPTYNNAFAGTYDGGNHTIRNWVLKDTGDYVAMFPYLSGTVKNLTLDSVTVTGERWTGILAGGIVGTASLIDNVHIQNSNVSKTTGNGMATIAVQAYSDSAVMTVKNCTVSNVTATYSGEEAISNMGLLLSRSRKDGAALVENCYVYNCTLIGNFNNISGLVGECEGGTIRNCGVFDLDTDKATYTAFGALVGNAKINTVTFQNCYTDLQDLLGANNLFNNSNADATVVENNCYTTVTDLTSGALAYQLRNGTDTNWIQTATHPMVGEGQMVVQVDYVADGSTLATTYTDSNGDIITPYTETLTKDGFVFKEWASTTASNGDLTLTAVFVDVKDLNNDGDVNMMDVILLLRHLVGYNTAIDLSRADISKNGSVSVYDAILLLRKIV